MLIQVFGPSGVGKSTILDSIDSQLELSGILSAAVLKDKLSHLFKTTNSDERKTLVIDRFGQPFLDKCFSLIWNGGGSAPQKQYSAAMLYRSFETEALIERNLSSYIVLADELTLHRSINVLLFCKDLEKESDWFFSNVPNPDMALMISALTDVIEQRVTTRAEQHKRNTYFDFTQYSLREIIERQQLICSIGVAVLSERTKCLGFQVDGDRQTNLLALTALLNSAVNKGKDKVDELAYLTSAVENCAKKIKSLTAENALLKDDISRLSNDKAALMSSSSALEARLSNVVRNYLESDQRALEKKLVDGLNEIKLLSVRVADLTELKHSLSEKIRFLESETGVQREKLLLKDRELSTMTEKLLLKDRELSTMTEKLLLKDRELSTMIEKLSQSEKDSKAVLNQLDVVKRERERLKTSYQEAVAQCKSLMSDIKRIKARLLYKLMAVIGKNIKSPIGILKLPILIVSEILAHKRAKPIYRPARSLSSDQTKGRGNGDNAASPSGDKPRKIDVNAVLSDAGERSSLPIAVNAVGDSGSVTGQVKGSNSKSAVAEEKTRLLQFAENLTIANTLTEDDKKWLFHVNKYLRQFEICGIKLRPGNEPRFFRIYAESKRVANDGPLISVIMPAFNAEKTLELAAQSILNQTWRNIELIIVDDKSSDSTWSIAQGIAVRDSRVKVLKNEVNVGPYVSKNRALSIASGEYITGHDADDWAHPERLQNHIEAMLSRSIDTYASITFMIRMTESGVFEESSNTERMRVAARRFPPTQERDGFLRVASISAMFNADAFRKVLGAWDSVRFGADSELIARASIAFGDGFKDFRQLGMLCLSSEGSLTSHPVHGVDPVQGISPSRRYYRTQWTEWQETVFADNARLEFPLRQRPFDAPKAAIVPLEDVLALMASDNTKQ